MAQANFKVLISDCLVAPPPGSVPSTSLPLTFFDIPWLRCIPMQRLFFYEYPYPTNHFLGTVLPSLKHSLSLSLQHFFPFAANLICPPGHHKPHVLYADGDSIPFSVAESTADFNYLIADYPRDLKDLYHFVPELPSVRVLEDGTRMVPLMAIQVTAFPCSGFSIGVVFHHVVADGRAFHHFMKSWASICRTNGCLQGAEPSHNRVEIKDPNELELNFWNQWWDWASKWEVKSDLPQNKDTKVRATIVLSQGYIQKLKHWVSISCTNESDATPYISTFVVACALFWVCLLRSEEESRTNDFSGDDELSYLLFSADCRNRYELSIPSTYFGNCLALCMVPCKRRELVGESGMVQAVKAVGKKIKELESSGALRGAERWLLDFKELREQGHHRLTVVGSPKLSVYQTDFGWGRPKKSEVVQLDKSPFLSLSECRDEDGGIELALALPKVQMDKFNSILEKCLEIK